MTINEIEQRAAIIALKAETERLKLEQDRIADRLRQLGAGPKRGRPAKNGWNAKYVSPAGEVRKPLMIDAVAPVKRKGRTWTAAQKREASQRAKARVKDSKWFANKKAK
jgi:hypothetical protein